MISEQHSHRRRNLLTGEWVLVSPQRTERPWQGQVEEPPQATVVDYDPDCYLCPGNARANERRNPDYQGPYSFENDFPALTGGGDSRAHDSALFRQHPEHGICRVICFSEKHDRHLVDMSTDELCEVLRFLAAEFTTLDQRAEISYVQVFENRGEMMGCSNPHPHAQVWATGSIPGEAGKELKMQGEWLAQHGRPLLIDYLNAEIENGSRIVSHNAHAVSMVPFWATWPFETLLIPRSIVGAPDEFADDGLRGFAEVLLSTLKACDALFGTEMPYSMGFHPRPSDGGEHPEWQFHAHIYPPLLRSASVRKHMVGFEMLGMPQRDVTPEAAAERLRNALKMTDKNDQQ